VLLWLSVWPQCSTSCSTPRSLSRRCRCLTSLKSSSIMARSQRSSSRAQMNSSPTGLCWMLSISSRTRWLTRQVSERARAKKMRRLLSLRSTTGEKCIPIALCPCRSRATVPLHTLCLLSRWLPTGSASNLVKRYNFQLRKSWTAIKVTTTAREAMRTECSTGARGRASSLRLAMSTMQRRVSARRITWSRTSAEPTRLCTM